MKNKQTNKQTNKGFKRVQTCWVRGGYFASKRKYGSSGVVRGLVE